jgi:UDP-3-O-[3-hydroxymyristoyl] glucosamine N-acyltransferase
MKTLGEIAELVGGKLRGDPSIAVKRVVHPASASGPDDLALVLSPSVIPLLRSGVVTSAVVPLGMDGVPTPNQILVDRPRVVLAKLTEIFQRLVFVESGVHLSAVVHPSAFVDADVRIGPHCWVGPNARIGARTRLVCNVSIGADVEVGHDCLLHASVCIGDRSQLGNRVIIQPNAVIGGDGFAFVTPEPSSIESVRETGQVRHFNTELIRINSVGHVVIEDDVEIGCATCIDRGTLGETRVGRGSKIDNLVQVGHNVTIGQNCLIVAQVGLGGSSVVGNRAVLGGQVGLPDHLTIGDDAVVHAQAGITNHVRERTVVIGSPAQPKRDFLEREVHLKRLPAIYKAIKELQRKVAELEKLIDEG